MKILTSLATDTFPREVGLTDAELYRLAAVLKFHGRPAMNIERFSGLFAALTGPDVVPERRPARSASAARFAVERIYNYRKPGQT